MIRWPWRRRAEESGDAAVAALSSRSEGTVRGWAAMAEAAGTPLLPAPSVVIKLPIEGSAEVTFNASSHGELTRLVDWLDEGPYASIARVIRTRGQSD